MLSMNRGLCSKVEIAGLSGVELFLFLCSLPPGCEFGQADMQKLVPKEEKPSNSAANSGGRRTGKKTLPHGDSA